MIFKRTCLFGAIISLSLMGRAARADEQTALDRYVAAPDASYSFHVVGTYDGLGFKTHVLEMTSQTWLSTREVDRPVWKHWLVIVVPNQIKTSTALLLINGGSNDRPAPTSAPAALALAAVTSGASKTVWSV